MKQEQSAGGSPSDKTDLQMDSRAFLLNKQTFQDMINYIEDSCREFGGCENAVIHIAVASSEILANIDSYAYPDGGPVEILICRRDNRIIITFRDKGKPFNPLKVSDPDIHAPLNERKPGGLGIFIVRKLMSDVRYQYNEGQNILTMEKEF